MKISYLARYLMAWYWYFLPAAVLAQGRFGLDEFGAYTNLGRNINLIISIARIINILLGFLGVIAVILVLWGGFKWMTSAGDTQKITEAKKILSGGVIGLIIILASYALAAFVVNQLTEATGYKG